MLGGKRFSQPNVASGEPEGLMIQGFHGSSMHSASNENSVLGSQQDKPGLSARFQSQPKTRKGSPEYAQEEPLKKSKNFVDCTKTQALSSRVSN